MNELDNLIIYKQYLELIYYTETISQKYPKKEKFCLVQSIKNNTIPKIVNTVPNFIPIFLLNDAHIVTKTIPRIITNNDTSKKIQIQHGVVVISL